LISAREAAYISLSRCLKDNKFANLEIDAAIKKHGLFGAERSLFTVLVYGTIERLLTLDFYLSKCSDKPLDKLDPQILCILRLSAYQILFLDRVPDHAAVNEGVELAKKYLHKGAKGFVNAVLRRLILTHSDIIPPTLSVKYSIPEWIIELWTEQYGQDKTIEILEGMNGVPYMTLRVNTLVTTRKAALEKLAEYNIEAQPCEQSECGINILCGVSFAEIEDVLGKGAFVQDEASQLTVEAIGALPGDFVIDTCSCPGGKSFGIAIAMNNKGKLLSLDLHESKLGLVEKGAERLGISIISTRAHDSKEPLSEYIGKADKVLCDVPCSGLGVMAKKPETRYKEKASVLKLPEIQYAILNSSAEYLKPGGTLVYSTCTLNKLENDNIIEKFLSTHSDFVLEKMATLFPVKHKSDGFFHAKLIKINDQLSLKIE